MMDLEEYLMMKSGVRDKGRERLRFFSIFYSSFVTEIIMDFWQVREWSEILRK